MAYPNLLSYKGSSNILQVMSSSELETLSHAVLSKLSANTGTGALDDTDGGSWTSLGTFTDNFTAGDPGSTNITINSTTYTLYQNLTVDYVDTTTVPVAYNSSSDPTKTLTDSQLNDLADEIIQEMVLNDERGSYVLATTAPTSPAGSTWTSVATITNKASTNNTASTHYVWKNTTAAPTVTYKPMKVNGSSVQEMSSAEIDALVGRVQRRIRDTGIGQYSFGASAPGTGTWVSVGSIADTQYDTSSAGYVGSGTFYGPGVRQVISGNRYNIRAPSYVGGRPTFFNPQPITNAAYTGTPTYFGALVGDTTSTTETIQLWRRVG